MKKTDTNLYNVLKERGLLYQCTDENALKEALESGHGYVIDCTIDMDEMVRPMVSGGSHITQFIIS